MGRDAQDHRLALWVLAPRGVLEFDLMGVGSCALGRSPSAHICIDDASVSRVHARLTRGPDGFTLEDLGSKNGTFVNGARLGADPQPVRPGDAIRCGNVALELRLVAERQPLAAKTVTPEELDSRVREEAERCLRFDRSLGVATIETSSRTEEVTATMRSLVAESLRSFDAVAVRGPGRIDVLLPECLSDEAVAAARRVTGLIEARGIVARVGVAVFPRDAPSGESLLRAAHLAMRSAPECGLGIAHQASRMLMVGPREVILAEPAMLKLYGLVERVAASTIPVLIVGETGSGKEIVAEAVHALGPRAAKPLVRLNCSALPENLLESELFGYERGAFTGAADRRLGLFEQADGGTLFLDEISEMSSALQAKLLRVLEDRRVRRLGAAGDHTVDVRFVAATHRDLGAMVADGAFREDLFYRLNAMVLRVPPLRERPREIVLLAEHFAAEAARAAGRSPAPLSPAAEAALQAHPWPGNVRELRNVMGRAIVLCDRGAIDLPHLPPEVASAPPRPYASPRAVAAHAQTLEVPLHEELRALEKSRILQALEACGGNQTRAAEMLQMPRRTFVSRLASLGIAGPRKRRRSEHDADEA